MNEHETPVPQEAGKEKILDDDVVVPEGADQDKLKEIVEKDSKSGRLMGGFWEYFTAALGIFLVFFYFYQAGVAPVDDQYSLGIYVMITYVLVFICYPFSKKSPANRPSVGDLVLCVLCIAAIGYWIVEFEDLNYRMGAENALDTAASIVGVLLGLEVARRVLGWALTLVGAVFLVYGFYGDLLMNIPVLGAFAHDGFTVKRVFTHVYLKSEGVFGIMANVLVNYVILFIFFGSFLKKSGAAHFFLDLPTALAGRAVGGPAKVAVIASGFFGSVSGSAIANTVSTGAFTIPLMKKAGFKPHVAGAIEPAASIGGMFMPPIMGAGGFIMAEMTEIPYVEIMKMAVFPAIIYFLSVFVMVHFEAKRYGLVGQRKPDDPTAWEIFKKEWFLSIPLVVIVVYMLLGYSPGMAATWGTLSCVVVSWFTKDSKMGPRQILEAMVEGARNTLIIGATVGVIGIIVGVIQLTGIGLKFSTIIIDLSNGILPLAVLLIGLASLVLGMGVPVTAAYLITAVLTVSAMSHMISMTHFGVPFSELQENTQMMAQAGWVLIASHMIVYWFSQDSNITPPVCVAAYAGAAIAGADAWKTGWTSFKFAKMLYVGPLLFAYSEGFLLHGPWHQILMDWFTIILGTVAFGSVTMGYLLCPMNILEWIVMAVATALLFFPELLITPLGWPQLMGDVIGIALWVLTWLSQRARIKKDPTLTLPVEERKKLAKAAS